MNKIKSLGVSVLSIFIMFYACGSGNEKSSDRPQNERKVETKETPAQVSEPVKTSNSNKLPPGDYRVKVINKFRHDPEAYTQGLVYYKGYIYEGTGLNGQSSLRLAELNTGIVRKLQRLADIHFGEGIAILNNKIYQLTWRSETCFVYDLESFKPVRSFSYEGEGWGLTTDGKQLIMSDGTSYLKFINPANFSKTSVIQVLDNGRPVTYLNELEFINGEVWANVYTEDVVVRINPNTGEVTGWIDLSPLKTYVQGMPQMEVLNGIAWDADNDRYFFTGKLWPYLFEVKFEKK